VSDHPPGQSHRSGDERPMTGAYVGVVIVQVLTLVGLWIFQTRFGH
jgi:hypothetical protein